MEVLESVTSRFESFSNHVTAIVTRCKILWQPIVYMIRGYTGIFFDI